METVDEARIVVLETGKALHDTPGTNVQISLVAQKLGMTEEIAEELEEMAIILDQRSSEWTLMKLAEGNMEEASVTGAGSIGTAALIGYRLGCAHTAERVTTKEGEE